ncbi:enhancer of split M1 protein [Eupeodes corollae]|uniref:enhancer of split M1 protein n=1 Tax=Eupeodes corollae TaxID=290404 RepID=UPI002492A4CB|nr:enhancer of split M1 protein [Eupeodes corollae]
MNNLLKLLIFSCVTLIATATNHGENLDDVCPHICPDIFEPICGTDGTEYVQFENHCEMNVFNCKRRRSTLLTYSNIDMDWCTTSELNDSFDMFTKENSELELSCMKPCPMILRPVCGSNGEYRKTFSNDCEMEMFNCLSRIQRKNEWRLLKSASCSI